METKKEVVAANNNISEEDNQFVEEIIQELIKDSDIMNEVHKIEIILSKLEETISDNDKKINRLLKLIEYLDKTNENSSRTSIETLTSICLALSVFGIEQMPAENKPLIALMVGALAKFGFIQFHDSANEKILNNLYKKLGEIASNNGKLKGIYKDLDAKVSYYDTIEKGNYVIS